MTTTVRRQSRMMPALRRSSSFCNLRASASSDTAAPDSVAGMAHLLNSSMALSLSLHGKAASKRNLMDGVDSRPPENKACLRAKMNAFRRSTGSPMDDGSNGSLGAKSESQVLSKKTGPARSKSLEDIQHVYSRDSVTKSPGRGRLRRTFSAGKGRDEGQQEFMQRANQRMERKSSMGHGGGTRLRRANSVMSMNVVAEENPDTMRRSTSPKRKSTGDLLTSKDKTPPTKPKTKRKSPKRSSAGNSKKEGQPDLTRSASDESRAKILNRKTSIIREEAAALYLPTQAVGVAPGPSAPPAGGSYLPFPSMWTCICGFELRSCMKFCGMCATPQNWTCQECQFSENLCVFRFCGGCATPKASSDASSTSQASTASPKSVMDLDMTVE